MYDILLIVEGEKQEKKLMKRLFELYNFPAKGEYRIWQYKACIYDLYDRVFKNNDDEDIDLLMTLREYEPNPNTKEIFNHDYSDIILIFDFDPQDHRYDKEKIIRLERYFSDSQAMGKLYINYPMVEAFKHTILNDGKNESFKNRMVNKSDLSGYKEKVGSDGKYTTYKLYSKETCDEVIIKNIKKGRYILGEPYEDDFSKEAYLKMNLSHILHKQAEFLDENGSFFVLCTCIFFITDFNFDFIQQGHIK